MSSKGRYSSHVHHLLAVDCVILGYEKDELKLLLYPRGFEPSIGQWSLMGGFLKEDENLDQAAERVLQYRTGLSNIFMEEVGCFSDPNRDPEARVVSVGYYALVQIDEQDDDVIRKHGAHWWPLTKLPELIFDHQLIVDEAIKRLRFKASYELVGKELLPPLFTITQLRNLYDAIFQRSFEPANFRKKILSLGVIKRQDFKNTTDSKRGAYYYLFDDSVVNKDLERIVKI